MKLRLAKKVAVADYTRWQRGEYRTIGLTKGSRQRAQRRIAKAFRNFDHFRLAVEGPYQTTFWGQNRECRPAAVKEIFGDGNLLLALTPLNTRPHYYMLRGDSRWLDGDRHEALKDRFLDELDGIMEAIEDQFGCADYISCVDDEDCYDCDCCESEREWPAASFSSGCAWGVNDWKCLLDDFAARAPANQ